MLPDVTKVEVDEFDPIVQAMLRDSSERWLALKDRSLPENAITICVEPPRAFVLTKGHLMGFDGWACDEGNLSGTELAEFFGSFGAVYPVWLQSKLGGKYPVRAFIKDGQDDWNFSVDTRATG